MTNPDVPVQLLTANGKMSIGYRRQADNSADYFGSKSSAHIGAGAATAAVDGADDNTDLQLGSVCVLHSCSAAHACSLAGRDIQCSTG